MDFDKLIKSIRDTSFSNGLCLAAAFVKTELEDTNNSDETLAVLQQIVDRIERVKEVQQKDALFKFKFKN
jgi:hypothetical protein